MVIPKLDSGTNYTSRANGYARGEGFAAIVMKTLSAAIADGDDIECVIAETAVNQDGRTKGLTVPCASKYCGRSEGFVKSSPALA